jgi:CheY-like chemotaxis protein
MPDSKGRVLVVDDEELVEEMLERILERLGYDHVSYNDPHKALAFFGVNYGQIDLVIVDQQLGYTTGAELSKEFLRMKPNIPIILISGHTKIWPEDQAGPLPVKRILTKPITKAELQEAVESVLGIIPN